MPGSANWDELNDRISRLSVTESSRDGAVQVTVSASGVLTGLVLKERWNQQPPMGAVAAQVMDCVARAQARIPDLLGRAMAETIGPGDPAAALVVADARKRFPASAPPPEFQPVSQSQSVPRQGWQPPAPRRPRPPERNDDDWDGRTVMEEDGV
ncbi:YbaB/EbfC family nucleoid-associated protein [Lentzea sp. NPDC059081]|uniref:YbaB/EbfC family nucleoid-associated protein n=1 Tax=Lentzea sp. NPDC059081 TaxID=3346719 RepID=UPI003685F888